MNTFRGIHFHGTFRDYQAAVLSRANEHLQDGRIHIVAAPGSGKTILGLELIRGMGAPALVLSPSVTIRQQWGERFEQSFLPEGSSGEDYISYDLKQPSLITSVTYQALHAAWSKSTLSEDDGEERSEKEDFSAFDLLGTIKKAGVTTVCLDEAHHLRSEWQKALEGFISKLGDVTLIALTATPPYDSNPAEWKRYHDLCGDIDEEIFVPSLVAQKTLCPHQDYIMFNYPSPEEHKQIEERDKKVGACVSQLFEEKFFARALESSPLYRSFPSFGEEVYGRADDFSAFFKVCASQGARLLPQMESMVNRKNAVGNDDIRRSAQVVLDFPEIFGSEASDRLRGMLTRASMLDRGKVCIEENESIRKALISSVGKLKSIERIAQSEYQNLGGRLRMLILTDYIKKDMLSIIGGSEEINTMGTVPVFETVRRSCPAKLGLLSGTLVILPDDALKRVEEIAKSQDVSFTASQIRETGYSRVNFSGSNKNKVSVITQAFGEGLFQILVGTKALLGEGWDSPCINSLILASFVGSFMLSNQMRGRAIRTDKSDPGKASNIWHLITLTGKGSALEGPDYDTVKRRFDCFMAPDYSGKLIESGMGRLNIIEPPYDSDGVERINQKMLSLAADREGMKRTWDATCDLKKQVTNAVETDETSAPVSVSASFKTSLISTVLLFAAIIAVINLLVFLPLWLRIALSAVAVAIAVPIILGKLKKLKEYSSAAGAVRLLSEALLETMKRQGVILSRDVQLKVISALGKVLAVPSGGTSQERQKLCDALGELLSPINNPRYILVNPKNPADCYSVPSVIAGKKENAEGFAAVLSEKKLNYSVIYTRSENGRRALLKAKETAAVNSGGKAGSKRVMS